MPAYVAIIFAFITLVVSFISYREKQTEWAIFAAFWAGYNFCLFVVKAFPS